MFTQVNTVGRHKRVQNFKGIYLLIHEVSASWRRRKFRPRDLFCELLQKTSIRLIANIDFNLIFF